LDPDVRPFLGQLSNEVCAPQYTEEFWKLLLALQKDARQREKLTGDISLGFGSDEALAPDPIIVDPDSVNAEQHTLNAQIDLRRGDYPGILKFKAMVDVTLKEPGGFSENIAQLHVAYDHYAMPWLKAYTFVDRYTDNFLEIDQRYEAGGGIIAEWNPLGQTKRGSSALGPLRVRDSLRASDFKSIIETLKGGGAPQGVNTLGIDPVWIGDTVPAGNLLWGRKAPFRWVRCFHAADSAAQVQEAVGDSAAARAETKARDEVLGLVKRLRDLRQRAVHTAEKKYARLRLAMLLGLFMEIENASLNIVDTMSEPDSMQSFEITPTQDIKWEVRPTVELRPIDAVHLRVHWYYKRSISEPFFKFTKGDYRTDFGALLTVRLSGGEEQSGSTYLVLDWRRLYDNQPAEVPVSTEGRDALARTTARLHHRRLRLGFKFNLSS
jgi:hypothetical protein